MAYDGAIEYMSDFSGNEVEWQDDVYWTVGEGKPSQIFAAAARAFKSITVTGIKFDDERTELSTDMGCVVLGLTETQKDDDRDCYVLVITKNHQINTGGLQVLERLGVGKIKGTDIAWGLPRSEVFIG